jgi:hypothetical protein
MKNFSAACVGEKLTTLTSTRPASLPAFMTNVSYRQVANAAGHGHATTAPALPPR